MSPPDADAGLDRALLHDAIVHDLNNLLTAVGGGVEQIAEASAPEREDVAELLAAVADAALLVRLLSRQAWEGAVTTESLDAARVLRVVARLARKLVPRGVEVRLTSPEGPLPAVADEVRVSRVLLTACTRIGARARSGEVVELSGDGTPSGARLRVAADGRDPIGGRAGLESLARLAKEAGAVLDSEDGDCVLLLSREAKVAEPAFPAMGRLERVLVAESDGLVRSFLVSALAARSPVAVHDARFLEDLLERDAPGLDLVLLSTTLEGLDLREDFGRLRTRHPALPVVLVAGDERLHDEAVELARSDRRTVLLERPFGTSRLAASIAELTEEAPHSE